MGRKKQLTSVTLERYKPKKTREILWDRDGLGILIGARKKTWIFQYSFEGKRPMMKLGEYPAMSFEEAKGVHAEARKEVSKGIDPGAKKKTAREAHKAAPTLEQFVEEIDTFELTHKKSGKETKRLLTHDIVPVWGKRKVADIKCRDRGLFLAGI